jgi:hypothetical protein
MEHAREIRESADLKWHRPPLAHAPVFDRPFSSLQRTAGNLAVQRHARARSADAAPDELAPPIVFDMLRSPGQSLDAATRDLMQRRFRFDFSHVRVHTDSSSPVCTCHQRARLHRWTGCGVRRRAIRAGHEGRKPAFDPRVDTCGPTSIDVQTVGRSLDLSARRPRRKGRGCGRRGTGTSRKLSSREYAAIQGSMCGTTVCL